MANTRLQFEPDLIAEITASTPRRRRNSHGVWLLTFPVVFLLAAAVALIGAVTEPGLGAFLFFRTNPNLAALARDFTAALRSPDQSHAMSLFLPSDHAELQQRLIGDMRRDLEAQGV